MSNAGTPERQTYTPRYPALIAFALCSVWVVLLFVPMFNGMFLGGPLSDQTWTGIPFREFWLEEVRRAGSIPQWNPFLFGGLPFVGAMHGDIFYPTSFLRLFLRVDVALNATFFIHLVLAGCFTYLFLRSIEVSWTGSVAGAVAYQLSGIVASLVSPGHDGKMIVSALMPLALTGLVLAIRRSRPEGYGLLALVTGLGIISPHLQMMQYTLILAGLFTLWLLFVDERRPAGARARTLALAFALGAVALGFAIAAVQLLPFIKYMPFAARAAGAQGWLYATSWAMPPENIVDWFVPEFTGLKNPTYWGSNGVKLHSEYVGAATLLLAAVGVTNSTRRRFLWFALGAGLLFLLVSLGGHTPFYRLWYEIVPGVKVTRAAGMAFFIPTFLICVLAAFGVERLEKGQGTRIAYGGFGAAAVLLLLGGSGALGNLAETLSGAAYQLAVQNGKAIALGAARSALVIAAAAALAMAILRHRVAPVGAALLLALVIGGDQFYNARRYFAWSPPAPVIYEDDAVSSYIRAAPLPHRTADLVSGGEGAYPTAFLMAKRIPSLLGHHGNELHAYDQLLGGKNAWLNSFSPRLWDLLAVRFLILGAPIRVPGYSVVERTFWRDPINPNAPPEELILFERDSPPAWARVVTGAMKVDDDQSALATVLDTRLDFGRLVLLPGDAPVVTPALEVMPEPSESRATVSHWEPGAMTIRLDPAPAADAYLLVSENWYPDWRATVDGRDVPVLRGNHTLITVPLPRGAREVQLRFTSSSYRAGRAVTIAAAAGALIWLLLPAALRRRRA